MGSQEESGTEDARNRNEFGPSLGCKLVIDEADVVQIDLGLGGKGGTDCAEHPGARLGILGGGWTATIDTTPPMMGKGFELLLSLCH